MENLTTNEQIKKLHELIIHANDLNEVLKYGNRINIFKILKMEKTEIRHSNILAWLLDSGESHGLDDLFIISWFGDIVESNLDNIKNFSINRFLLNSTNTFTVYREKWNIDILLVSEQFKQVIVIENKIDTGEHDNQLQKYENRIEQEYKDYEKLYVFLTPYPENTTELSSNKWFVVGYQTVANCLNRILSNEKNIDEIIKLIIKNYLEIIRGEIMKEDTEVKKLSLEIYKKYQDALDIIYNYLPDQQQNVKDVIDEVLQEIKIENRNIILLPSAKSYIRFTTEKLHRKFENLGNGKWIKDMLDLVAFEIVNVPNSELFVKLLIAPSDNKEARDILTEKARQNKFDGFLGKGSQWIQIFKKRILSLDKIEETISDKDGKSKIKKILTDIINNDIKKIEDILI